MTTDTSERIEQYFMNCRLAGLMPTKKGLAINLNTTVKTLQHVCKGYYNSTRAYTMTPHVKRCIDNNDFEKVKVACKRIEMGIY